MVNDGQRQYQIKVIFFLYNKQWNYQASPENNIYLSITFSGDLKRKSRITNTVKRGNSTLGFPRSNPRHAP